MLSLREMRERSVKVDTEKLNQLSQLYKGAVVARSIGVSKQLWQKYKKGSKKGGCDMPESVVDRLCGEYKLDKALIVVESI